MIHLTADIFFDVTNYDHKALFVQNSPVWNALENLKSYINDHPYSMPSSPLIMSGGPLAKSVVIFEERVLDAEELTIEYGDATKGQLKVYKGGEELPGASVIMAGAVLIGQQISLGRGVLVESGAFIKSPTIIGDHTEVRQGAYLRGYCLVGKRCVVGHVTEVKHSIFMDDAKAGHFAYLGDSILGYQVNLGAGTKLANLRFTSGNVQIKTAEGPIATNLRKFGAILGDHVQTGCNSVTNPGALLGKRSLILPNTTAPSGYHGGNSIIR